MKIATVQSEVTDQIDRNGKIIRSLIKQAFLKGADLVHFCEGALSGYTSDQIGDPSQINFGRIRLEITSIQNLARKYKLWIVIGCAHELSNKSRPHNSMYIISDDGSIVNRYDKRMLSNNEIENYYTPGFDFCAFSIKGIKFSCALCIEVNFPNLFIEAAKHDIDCILFSSYSKNPIFGIQCQGYAATHNYWISMAIPKNESSVLPSQFIGPDGHIIKKCIRTRNSIIINDIHPNDEKWNIPVRKAQPWRKIAMKGQIYDSLRVKDERSSDKTIY